jgi:glucan phosphoethanolaminetransferase (alkaline phosphatase superfamily)
MPMLFCRLDQPNPDWIKYPFEDIVQMMMPLILLLSGNLFILIISLVGVQASYFRRRWKWFWAMLVCVIMSGMCLAVTLYQWLAPPTDTSLPTIVIRQPTTPL